MKQKAVIVLARPDTRSRALDELNVALEQGWRVARMTPMGAAAGAGAEVPTFAALVLLERDDDTLAEAAVALAEEEELLDELLEGDGSSAEVSDDFGPA